MKPVFSLPTCIALALGLALSAAEARPPAKSRAPAATAKPRPVPEAAAKAPVPEPPSPASDGPALPEFSLPDLDGRIHSSREFAGKAVVVDFWATWCAACKESIPKLVELHERHGSSGLVVVGISVDKGSPDKVRKAARKLGIEYLVLHDKDNTLAKSFGFTGIPSLYVYDRRGGLRKSMPGYDPAQEGLLAEETLSAMR